MKTIITVFKKELKASLREKRTILTVLILPLILFPLMFTVVFKVQKSVFEKNASNKIKIALINPSKKEIFNAFSDPKFKVFTSYSYEEAIAAITTGELDVLIDFEINFEEKLDALKSGKLSVVYKSTDEQFYSKISGKLDQWGNDIKNRRLKKLGLDQEVIKPIVIESKNLSSKKEIMVDIAGGFLPYMFVIFIYLGCMYPAIDLTTGEKEKNTMETLLTAPVSRSHILLGKIFTMCFFGLMSAFITILGVFLFVQLAGEIPQEISESIRGILSVKFIVLLLGMLAPFSFFMSSILSWLAITANSFKEAQSRIQPLMIVMMVPVLIGLSPGIVLNWKTAALPILNISLTTKALLNDSVNYALYGVTVLTLVVIAIVAILISKKRFSNESIVLS